MGGDRPEFTVVATVPRHRGAVVSMETRTIRTPDGSQIERDVVRHPGAVSVVPLTDGGEVVMVRQYRAAVGEWLLEIPAGKRDVAGEPAIDTARRELAEEVGLVADTMVQVARFYNSPGFCDEDSHVFVATDLHPVADSRQGPEEAAMTVERVRLADVPTLVAAGEIVDAKTIIGCLCALDREHQP